MRVRVRHLAAAFAGLLAVAAMTSSHAVAQGDDGLPESPGKGALVEVCTQCHVIGVVIAQNRDPQEWDEILTRMVALGAPATADQQTAILAYLQKNFARTPPPAATAASPH